MTYYTLSLTGSQIDDRLITVQTLSTNLSELTTTVNTLSTTLTSFTSATNQRLQTLETILDSGRIRYLTTAPTGNNASGCLTFVVLSQAPAQRYNGYLYIITED